MDEALGMDKGWVKPLDTYSRATQMSISKSAQWGSELDIIM